MKVSRFIAVFTAVLFLFLLGGCYRGEPVSQSEQTKVQHVRVGFSMATLLEDRWLRDRDIFQSKAEQKGIDVIVRNANRDSEIQYAQVQELLGLDIDVLVITPNDAEKEVRCVKLAKDQGVPVIVYDRLIRNSGADVYIAFDNIMVGRLMGEYLIEHAGNGGYLLVNGPKSDNNCPMIREGYMEVLEPYITSGDIWIVDETWIEDWVRENAYSYVKERIDSYRDNLTAVICGNDSLAWGVTDAFGENRIGGVEVVGMDADISACQRIVAGRQGLTVYKPIQDLVSETLAACEKLALGQPLDTVSTLYDGQTEIPYIAIEVYPVTQDTIKDTVIADGFHLEEDIYN